jgi:hypothetical protein
MIMRATSGAGVRASDTHQPCTVMLFKTSDDKRLLARVRGEYRELPGMRLTIEQAMRLWSLDRQACTGIFDSLVASHDLEIDGTGRYRKAHAW